MPLFLADLGFPYTIVRIGGHEKSKHYLESLGFIPGTVITVVSRFNNYFLIRVKGSSIGISEDLAKKIIILKKEHL